MARKRDRAASRDAGFTRLLLGLTLCGAGIAGGILLGGLAVGTGLGDRLERETSYADLSGNPAAPATDSLPELTCLDCADGYGVAARLRTIRDARSDRAFRALGAVEIEYAPTSGQADDYRYGGRFPDPERAEIADQPPIAAGPAEDTLTTAMAGNDPPLDDPAPPGVPD